MNRLVAAVVVSLLAGFAVGALVMTGEHDEDASLERPPAGLPGADAGADGERLARLERIVTEEREARLALEDTLAMLFEELERLERAGGPVTANRPAEAAADAAGRRERQRAPRNEAEWMRDYAERRVARLVEGGFSEDEARRILQQESEASFRSMQLLWEVQRSGEDVNRFERSVNPQALLRDELGDADYARYLEAQGQPTSVRVTQVLSGSPARRAGLQPGDQLVSYNGERIFNVGDLRNLTMRGEPGEDVVIEVERDGVRMQLTVPRGPIGITGSGANVRGLNWWGG